MNYEVKNKSQAVQEGENVIGAIFEDLGFIFLVFLSFNLFYFSFFNLWFYSFFYLISFLLCSCWIFLRIISDLIIFNSILSSMFLLVWFVYDSRIDNSRLVHVPWFTSFFYVFASRFLVFNFSLCSFFKIVYLAFMF